MMRQEKDNERKRHIDLRDAELTAIREQKAAIDVVRRDLFLLFRSRAIGIHFTAAEALRPYIQEAGLTGGSLFRPRLNSRSEKLGVKRLSSVSLWRLLLAYLTRLQGAMEKVELRDGVARRRSSLTAAWTSGRSKTSSGTPTSRRRRFTTSGVWQYPRARRTTCQFK